MSDYPMLISNKLHSFRNFIGQKYDKSLYLEQKPHRTFVGKGDKMQP